MKILTITIEGKKYTLQDTLLTKEYREVMNIQSDISDVAIQVTEGNPKEIQKSVQKLSNLKKGDWDILETCVKRCYGIPQKEMDNIHAATAILLFAELWKATTVPKKNSSTQSTSE